MATDKKIPGIPTRNVSFKDGTLNLEILEGCAYWPEENAFTGGDWVKAHFETKEGNPVWISLEGGELVISTLTNYLVEESTGYKVGGKKVEIARFNICE